MEKRASGVLLHISSLPGPYGIGTLGKNAYRFIDFLKLAGQTYWQVLPLGPTGFGDSPYQSSSAFAGNPYLIDLDMLHEQGLIESPASALSDDPEEPDYADFSSLSHSRLDILQPAYEKGQVCLADAFAHFKKQHAPWLLSYAAFTAIKEYFDGAGLADWPDKACAMSAEGALDRLPERVRARVDFHAFVQFLFFEQWSALRRYANRNGIKIIGDIPIYVSADSAEVWAQPELFRLTSQRRPSAVAGVPPDAYSQTGQLWGNPLYDWDYHKKTDYDWWIRRMRHTLGMVDAVRIDHFRGFEAYWEIPSGAQDAREGRWCDGPGLSLIHALTRALPRAQLIAEDLGDLDDRARSFFKAAGYPGMSVLVHAFDPDEESVYLPHNIKENSVAYTSTHDSDTFVGWLCAADGRTRAFAEEYLHLNLEEGFAWGAVRAVWASCARIAIAPMQDILGLGADARMNIPSTIGGQNWRWRVRGQALNDEVAARLLHLTQLYKRTPDAKGPLADSQKAFPAQNTPPQAMDCLFWEMLDTLVKNAGIVIDRPKGSVHPVYPALCYEVDYGYLEGTRSADGDGIGVWVGEQPNGGVDAVICVIDLLKRQSEIKLLIGCSDAEKSRILRFHNLTEGMKGILVSRE